MTTTLHCWTRKEEEEKEVEALVRVSMGCPDYSSTLVSFHTFM